MNTFLYPLVYYIVLELFQQIQILTEIHSIAPLLYYRQVTYW